MRVGLHTGLAPAVTGLAFLRTAGTRSSSQLPTLGLRIGAGAARPDFVASRLGFGRAGFSSRTQGALSTSSRNLDVLSRVSGLVGAIRGFAATKQGNALPGIQSQERIDAALLEIGRLTGTEVRLGGPQNGLVTGINASQIRRADLLALAPQEDLLIQGSVTQVAETARLTVLGNAGGLAAQTATFQLTGNLGTATIAMTEAEQLADVSDRINDQTHVTGVSADVSGDNLVLQSVGVGSGAIVRLEQVNGGGHSTAGLDDAQVSQFDVSELSVGGTETIAGDVLSTATYAELRYLGNEGATATGTATLLVAGTRGNVSVAVTADESLVSVAERVNAETASTGVSASVDGNDLLLRSDTVGSSAFVQVQPTELAEQISTTGLNTDQIDGLQINSIDPGSQHTFTGEMIQTASHAELDLLVADQGVVADSATFQLTGSAGSANVSLVAGESLSDVVSRINALSASTGVTAQQNGDSIELSSLATGSSQSIDIQLTSVDHQLEVSGANEQQLQGFQALALQDGAQHTLAGSITQTASQAELTFAGVLDGRVATNATFTLTGSNGSEEISVFALETLDAVAARINGHSAATGVEAAVQGNTLTLRSSGVGSSATVSVDVTAGTFDVDGGNGDGSANGSNAVAVINGETVNGSGNDFSFSDGIGSYSFTAAAGFTGVFDTVSIDSQPGQFEVAGGSGNGTATGQDALLDINGQQLTSATNEFQVSVAGADLNLVFSAGFSGVFDPVTVTSNLAEFELQGGDASGRITGADAVAVINGTQRSGAGNRFTVAEQTGTFVVEFAAGFWGEFDPITVTANEELLEFAAGDASGTATGTDARGLINGKRVSGAGSLFNVSHGRTEVAIEFAAGFRGQFDPISVTARAAVPVDAGPPFTADTARQLREILSSLSAVGSGGELAIGVGSSQQVRAVTNGAAQRLANLVYREVQQSSSAVPTTSRQPQHSFGRALSTSRQLAAQARLAPQSILAAVDRNALTTERHQRLLLQLLRSPHSQIISPLDTRSAETRSSWLASPGTNRLGIDISG